MMSEISFASTIEFGTPVARSRRRSVLRVEDADLSPPTMGKPKMELELELEIVGLRGELCHTEQQNKVLKQELESLRSQLSSSSSSKIEMVETVGDVTCSSSDLAIEGGDSKWHSAEVKAAKRLLHRLATLIANHDPASNPSDVQSHHDDSDDDKLFSLDQSLIHDPDRSMLNPCCTHLSTPNGKSKVSRSFAADLVDDIESVRLVWEESARKASFSAVEQAVSLQRSSTQNAELTQKVLLLQSQLQSLQSSASSLAEKQLAIDQLRKHVCEANQNEARLTLELQHSVDQREEAQRKLAEAEARFDRVEAERDLTISAAAKKSEAQIEALRMQLEEQTSSVVGEERIVELESKLRMREDELTRLESAQESAVREANRRIETVQSELERNNSTHSTRITELETQLSLTRDELERVKLDHVQACAEVARRETELEEGRTRSSEVESIMRELAEKRKRLLEVQMQKRQVECLQRVLDRQERIVGLLEASSTSQEWMEYAHELSASLAQLKTSVNGRDVVKCEVSTMTDADRVDAAVATDEPMELNSKLQDETVQENGQEVGLLKSKVDELEARVLRRNEQIGSLQKQLRNVENNLARAKTNQELAEQMLEDLDADRQQHLALIKQLESQLASTGSREQKGEDASTQTEQGGVDSGELDELQMALDESQAHVSALTHELEELSSDHQELTSEKEQLQDKLQQLESHISLLEATPKVELVETSMQTTHDEECRELETWLNTARDQMSSLNTQLESVTTLHTALSVEKRELEEQNGLLTARVATLTEEVGSSKEMERLVAVQEEELVRLKAAHRKVEERLATTMLEIESLNLSLAEQREGTSQDADRIETLQTQLSILQTKHDSLTTASSGDRNALDQSRSTIEELTSKIASLEQLASSIASVERERDSAVSERTQLQCELDELTSKQVELEREVLERDEAMRERNVEYWTLKEELAEMQEEAERSRSDVETSQVVVGLRGRLEEVCMERDSMRSRVCAQESALVKLKCDLQSARSTEELLNEQYRAAQRRAKDLESIVGQLESQPNQSSASKVDAEYAEVKQTLEKAEAEIRYLSGRIEELEEELGRKAEEIEEADSKILDALKESKKYATRYAKLSARYEALQAEAKVAEEKAKVAEEESAKLKAMQKEQRREGLWLGSSGSGESVAGRKRSKPDTTESGQESRRNGWGTSAAMESVDTYTSQADGVKAVYAPCPSVPRAPAGAWFTPIRRKAHKPNRMPSKPCTHEPIILGLGTPTFTTTTTTTCSENDMVRSTSNPSELIAARLVCSPAKPLLGDKTNMASGPAASGISRLSSKLNAGATKVNEVKQATWLLAAEGSRKRDAVAVGKSPHAKNAPPACAAGAADFLARMKAQRAAHTRS